MSDNQRRAWEIEAERERMCQSLNLKPPTAGWQPEGNPDPLLLHIQSNLISILCAPSSEESLTPQGSVLPLEMNVTELVSLQCGLLPTVD